MVNINADFKLRRDWEYPTEIKQDVQGDKKITRCVKDVVTGKIYAYNPDHEYDLRESCALKFMITPIAFSLASVGMIAFRVVSIAARAGLLPFRCLKLFFDVGRDVGNKLVNRASEGLAEKTITSIGKNLLDIGKDLLKIVATPLAFLGAEFAALYGAAVDAKDGGRLYAAIENFQFGKVYIAEEFRPIEDRGKDLNTINQELVNKENPMQQG